MLAEPLADINSNGTIVGDEQGREDDVNHQQNWRLYVKGIDNPEERVFRFNLLDQGNQYITVEDKSDTHTSIHTNQEFTVAVWIDWQGVSAGADQATILSKGSGDTATYALSILADGKIKFNIYRSVFQKQWYCWFGKYCDDGSSADNVYNEQVVLTTESSIPEGWTHVAATFGGETMRIYVNGQKIAESSTTSTWKDGWYQKRKTTNFLLSNSNPLLIAIDDALEWPYRGLMDDIQFFIRMLQVYNLGVCKP